MNRSLKCNILLFMHLYQYRVFVINAALRNSLFITAGNSA